jgi:hypothetical protein
MKTEELLRYEAEYQAMQEALGTHLLVFEFPQASTSCMGENEQSCQVAETRSTFIAEKSDGLKYCKGE